LLIDEAARSTLMQGRWVRSGDAREALSWVTVGRWTTDEFGDGEWDEEVAREGIYGTSSWIDAVSLSPSPRVQGMAPFSAPCGLALGNWTIRVLPLGLVAGFFDARVGHDAEGAQVTSHAVSPGAISRTCVLPITPQKFVPILARDLERLVE
jgi:hypothetical protein